MPKIEQLPPRIVLENKDKQKPLGTKRKTIVPVFDQEVYKIIKERVRDGMTVDFRSQLKPEQKKIWEETAGKLLQYLLAKYKRENVLIEESRESVFPDQEAPQGKNLYLFDFFSQGSGRDNIFKLDAILKEKTGTGIDFSDPGLLKIGESVMGPDNFKKYLENLYIENIESEERKFADEHRN
jgi:hypothetical protein